MQGFSTISTGLFTRPSFVGDTTGRRLGLQQTFGLTTRSWLRHSHASLRHILLALVAYLRYDAAQSPYPGRHRSKRTQRRKQPDHLWKVQVIVYRFRTYMVLRILLPKPLFNLTRTWTCKQVTIESIFTIHARSSCHCARKGGVFWFRYSWTQRNNTATWPVWKLIRMFFHVPNSCWWHWKRISILFSVSPFTISNE